MIILLSAIYATEIEGARKYTGAKLLLRPSFKLSLHAIIILPQYQRWMEIFFLNDGFKVYIRG